MVSDATGNLYANATTFENLVNNNQKITVVPVEGGGHGFGSDNDYSIRNNVVSVANTMFNVRRRKS